MRALALLLMIYRLIYIQQVTLPGTPLNEY